MDKFFVILFLFCSLFNVYSKSNSEASSEEYLKYYDELKTVCYNDETSTEDDVLDAYDRASDFANTDVENAQLEFLVGLYFLNNDNKENAKAFLEASMEKSKRAYTSKKTAESYTIYSEALSQYCGLMSGGYVIANGPKVPGLAKKALKLDPKMSGASYILACFYIYAPGIFKRINKGEKILLDTLDKSNFETDDYFNYYISISYAEILRKNYDEADKWLLKAESIYPNNKTLHRQMKHDLKTYADDVDTTKVKVKIEE